jgi:hypothetical protein
VPLRRLAIDGQLAPQDRRDLARAVKRMGRVDFANAPLICNSAADGGAGS